MEVEKPSMFCPDPLGFLDNDLIGRALHIDVYHLKFAKHIFHSTNCSLDDTRFHFPDFAPFHDNRVTTGQTGFPAEGILWSLIVHDNFGTERFSYSSHFCSGQISSHSWIVRSAN